jgi:hypothetical protein
MPQFTVMFYIWQSNFIAALKKWKLQKYGRGVMWSQTGFLSIICKEFSVIYNLHNRKVVGVILNEVIGVYKFICCSQSHYGSGVYSAFNRNKSGIFLGAKCFRLIAPPSQRLMSRKCENLSISQPYGPPRSITEMDLPLCPFFGFA